MKKLFRILIAFIFILSGFVKAVDIKGFSFKLEEYFSPEVFNIKFLEEMALPLAIFVVALELVLGFLLLLKLHLRKTLLALIALCVFFAFLTFYSAYFNKVTDCGCFGDAIKFTPWQSFIKDIILLSGLLMLFFAYRKTFVQNEEKSSFRKTVLVISMVATAFVIGWGIFYEPLIDFRDYKIGTNLNAERQKIAAQPAQFKTYYTLKNTKTGEEKEVNQDEYVNNEAYWKEGTPWEIEKDKTISKMVKAGYQSEIQKFYIVDANGFDISNDILNAPSAILVFSYAPEKADKELIKKISEKLKAEKNVMIVGISPKIGTFPGIPNGKMDATATKTIARSNPFVLILKKGVIIDKLPANEYLKN